MRITYPKINHVILIIITVQFLITTAGGLLAPFFAIFITQQIRGGTIAALGFAMTIYWVTKSILQLFVARYIDRNHGEYDDFYFFVLGSFLISVNMALYYWATEVWQVYAIHFGLAVADAFFVPPFYAIFTRHLDKGHEGFEWSLFSSFSVGAGSALGAALGGVFATIAGFRVVFLIHAMLTLMATLFLILLRPYIFPRVPQEVARIPIDLKKI